MLIDARGIFYDYLRSSSVRGCRRLFRFERGPYGAELAGREAEWAGCAFADIYFIYLIDTAALEHFLKIIETLLRYDYSFR